jgi:hypothetical protein
VKNFEFAVVRVASGGGVALSVHGTLIVADSALLSVCATERVNASIGGEFSGGAA